MKGLTKRQHEILNYIQTFITKNHFSPSYREIKNHFGFASLGSVAKHVTVLKRKGVLSAEKHTSRSLLPKEKEEEVVTKDVEVPFIGNISQGEPIEMFPKSQSLAIPGFFVKDPSKTYVLRAQGDSLMEELIADGDLLILEVRSDAFAGETIVATEQNRVIVKSYYPEGNSIRLESKTGNSITKRTDDLTIMGVLAGLLRLF